MPVRSRCPARALAAAALLWGALAAGGARAEELAPDALFRQVGGSVYVVLAADNADLKSVMGNPVVPPPEPETEGAAMPTARERALRATGRGKRPPLSLGSAVALAPDIAVTNCHVVVGRQLVVVAEGNRGVAAEIVDQQPSDICLLRVKGMRLRPVTAVRKAADLRVGERVYAIGNPRGLERTLSEGLLSGLRVRTNVKVVQTTAPISPGSSGGGLFDAQGRLIGVTTFKSRTDTQLNFAVATDAFWPLPEAVRAGGAVPAPAPRPPQQAAGGPLRLQDGVETRCGPILVRGIPFVTTALKCAEAQQRRFGSETVESTRLTGVVPAGTLDIDHARLTGQKGWGALSTDQLKRAVESWAKSASPSNLSPLEVNPFPHHKLDIVLNGRPLACARGHARGGPDDKVLVWIAYCEPGGRPLSAENLATVYRALSFE